jgi:hypothetical protein
MTQKSSKTLFKKVTSAFGLSLLLWGCGGGGGGGAIVEATQTLNGVAIDGYLKGATAFLDLNNNGEHDANEPKSITNENGQFTLNATASQFAKHRVVVFVPSGAEDSNTGPVDAPFKLISPAGEGSVVSPLTTLVAAHMGNDMSLLQATNKVKTDLGLGSFNVMSNFMASQDYLPIQKMAVAVTEVLKTISSPNLLTQLSEARTGVDLKIKPFSEEILRFDVSQGWGSLADRAKTWASSSPSWPLNDKWADFLLLADSPKVKTATSTIGNVAQEGLFSIMRTNNVVTLRISVNGSPLDRILTLSQDKKLVLTKSQQGNTVESIQFEGISLPEDVTVGDKGTYFKGTYAIGSTQCSETSAEYSVTAGNNIANSLKFTLTLTQVAIASSSAGGCINSLFRPTEEIYEFTLTEQGLQLNTVTARNNQASLSMTFE